MESRHKLETVWFEVYLKTLIQLLVALLIKGINSFILLYIGLLCILKQDNSLHVKVVIYG